MWKYTGQAVIGTSHEKNNTPCQDAYRIEPIDDRLIVVVADGAGSAKHSDIGAQLITQEAVALAKDWQPFENTEAEREQYLFDLDGRPTQEHADAFQHQSSLRYRQYPQSQKKQ